jgi:hypothetical protein
MRAIKVVTKKVATALRPNIANGISVSYCADYAGPLALTGALNFLSQMPTYVFDRDQSETVPLCRNFRSGEGLV